MNLFELLVYLALTAMIIPACFLSMLDFVELERSLEHQIDNAHAVLILGI